jgi:hypothetical protein
MLAALRAFLGASLYDHAGQDLESDIAVLCDAVRAGEASTPLPTALPNSTPHRCRIEALGLR